MNFSVPNGTQRLKISLLAGQMTKHIVLGIILMLFCTRLFAWESKIVYRSNEGKLIYVADSIGNRIPDFSHAGYKNSEDPIPSVPVVKTLVPIEGDNTVQIQNALFEIGLMTPDSNGYRGALLLKAGEYEIHGTIKLAFDGVVLRGEGDGDDPLASTILKATGNSPSKRTVLVAGGGHETKWADGDAGSVVNILSDSVMAGECSFEVEDASGYTIGDNIIIYHPCTAAWLSAVDTGGTFWYLPAAEPGVDLPWSVNSQPIVFNRYITDIQGNFMTIDVPVYDHLIRALAQSFIYRYGRLGIRSRIGIENLRIDIVTAGGVDQNHAWNAIDLFQIEDAWVLNCTLLHFGLSGIRTNTATRITIQNCQALDPVAPIDGGNMYNFQLYTASQQILIRDCHASNGRHHYMSNGTSWTSGCVFLDCTSSGAYASSEGHRRWSQALLYDNVMELDGPRPGYNPRLLGLYNRGHYGTSHGWALVHGVAWNCDVVGGNLTVQQPPTGQNYAIGCLGTVTGISPPAPFPVPEGYIEGTNQAGLEPRSLFLAQLEDRLGPAASLKGRIEPGLPQLYVLRDNFPNPFNPSTTISLSIGIPAHVALEIYNTAGEKIITLHEGYESAGTKQVIWDSRNAQGGLSASGMYFCIMKANGKYVDSIKMLLVR